MPVRSVIYHETETGRCVVRDYIKQISARKEHAKLTHSFEFIENHEQVPDFLLKRLKGYENLWEIRVFRHRFIAFYDTPNHLVVIHAFSKPSIKVQRHEIEVAAKRKAAYFPAAR